MNRKRCHCAVILLLFFSALNSFAAEPVKKKDWTFMIFMAADNNLEESAESDLNELEAIGSTNQVNVVVQLDRLGKSSFNNENKWAGAKRFLVQKDSDPKKVTSPVQQDLGEVDMATPAALTDFVSWTVKNYPAEKYALILWNHGTGWKEVLPDSFASVMPAPELDFQEDMPEGIAYNISYDDTSRSSMDIPTLGSTMAQVHQILGKKVDLLGFDACLMQMAEVAFEMAPHADYQVASPDREPDRGWAYDDILKFLADNSKVDGRRLGQKITASYRSSYNMGPQGNTAVILSLLDLKQVREFSGKLEVFYKAIRAGIMEIEKIERAKDSATSYVYDDYIDLPHFLKNLYRLSKNAKTKQATAALLNSISGKSKERLVAENALAGTKFRNCGGLAVFFPDRNGFRTYQKRYNRLQMSKAAGGWFKFLDEVSTPSVAYLKIHETILDDNNKDGKIAPGESVKVRLKIRNYGKLKSPKIQITCKASSDKIVFENSVLETTETPLSEKELIVGGISFKVGEDVPLNSEVKLSFSLSGVNVPDTTYRTTFFVKSSFVSSGHILLVFADGFSPAAPVLQKMFVENKVKFDIWDRMLDGDLKPDVLKRYLDGWVLVCVQDSSDKQALNATEVEALSGFLKTGGKLVLTGQDIAFSLRENDFLKTLCKVRFIQDDTNVLVVSGVEGKIKGMGFQIFGGDGANNQKWPDEVDALRGAKVIMKYEPGSRDIIPDKELSGPDIKPGAITRGIMSTGAAAVSVVDGYRLLFFAFGIESINERGQRKQIFQEILDFMNPGVDSQLTSYAAASARRSNARIRGQRTDHEVLEDIDLLKTLRNQIVRDVTIKLEKDPQFGENLRQNVDSMPEIQKEALGGLKKDLDSLLEFRRQHGTLK